ncbi:ubiquitin carboxyl-terminal hydrolase isozyme L3-like isoform X4 [Manis javanica]|uniref:ubiquitin carboxyl-terminal hydrolase isozyme L3-like isoform X4 n=1 Tax=Manis javanica TaxID=9974 RepID=UPI003C6D77E4
MHFESGSTLKKFLEESVSMSPEERARYLENYDAIRVTHETIVHEGQTERYNGGATTISDPPNILKTPKKVSTVEEN